MRAPDVSQYLFAQRVAVDACPLEGGVLCASGWAQFITT